MFPFRQFSDGSQSCTVARRDDVLLWFMEEVKLGNLSLKDLFPLGDLLNFHPTLNIGRDFSRPAWRCDLNREDLEMKKIPPGENQQWHSGEILLDLRTLAGPEAGSYKVIKCGSGHFIRRGFPRHVGKISLSIAPSPFITLELLDDVIPTSTV